MKIMVFWNSSVFFKAHDFNLLEWTEIDEHIPYKCSYEMIHKSMKDMKVDHFFIAATPKRKEF